MTNYPQKYFSLHLKHPVHKSEKSTYCLCICRKLIRNRGYDIIQILTVAGPATKLSTQIKRQAKSRYGFGTTLRYKKVGKIVTTLLIPVLNKLTFQNLEQLKE